MSLRGIILTALLAFALTMGHAGVKSTANAAMPGAALQSPALNNAAISKSKIIEVGRRYKRRYRRHRRRHNAAPFALGLFLGYALSHERRHYSPRRRHYGGSRCGYWSDRCADNWGYRNRNYYGCLRYHGCR